MANLNKMTREAMKEELELHGETPPAGWTRLEMKTRLIELRGGEETTSATSSPLQEDMKALRKAARKKADLIAFCREHQVPLNGNETIAMMETRAAKKLQTKCAATAYDHVGFGKHCSLMYVDILRSYKEYGQWVKQMYREDPEGTMTDPRLRRLAAWLIKTEETQNQSETPPKPNLGTGNLGAKGSRRGQFAPRDRGAASSRMMVDSVGTEVVQEQSRRLDQMADVIEQLRAELAATRGEPPRKGTERRVDEAYTTDGSYSVVSNSEKIEDPTREK